MEGGLLAALDADTRNALATLGRRKHFVSGAPLFLEGDLGGNVMIVRGGHVKVFATSANGNQRVLAVRGPGDVLGDLSAIDGHPRSASGIALEPVDVQVVRAEEFREFLATHAGAALALLHVVIARMRDSDRLRVEFGALDATARVAMRLVELAGTVGEPIENGIRLALPLTQDDLAGWVSASREVVTRALASLRRRGLITTARREITILDLSGLRDAAAG